LCGFNNLEREEKIRKANEILNSADLKQAICHQILGTTFKDVERAMEAVINERQLTEYQQEILELQEQAPEKFDLEFDFKLNKSASDRHVKTSQYRTYTQEEVAELMRASFDKPKEEVPKSTPIDYEPMDRETAERLVREHYEYKERERLRKEKLWALEKTIESVTKTATKTKRSNSTKASK
jgi:hypothetical protein